MVAELRQVKLSDVQFNPDIYPRKAHDPALVQKYAGCLEQIEERSHFMAVAEDLELLDGRHRHLAYLTVDPDQSRTVSVLVYPVTASADKFRLAVKLNSEHGHQLSTDDKKRCVLDGYTKFGMTVEEIAKEASVRKAVALEWTSAIRQAEQDRENEAIFDLWMACYTQEQIAEQTGVPQQTVARKLGELPTKFPGTNRVKLSEYGDEDWARPLFDIWNADRNANKVKHFGNTPVEFVDNLLYLYTEPFDIVIDPFAGGGSTIDVCQKRLRRYWVSDRKPITARENEIRKHDLATDGLSGPSRWADVALVYLDPPYWKQAAGKYSTDETDLANMPLEKFTETLVGIIHGYGAKLKPGAHIACIISPTQWPNEDKRTVYHDLDLARLVGKNLRLKQRILCPYSSQQYNGTQVDIAKEQKLLMALSRTMLVWERE